MNKITITNQEIINFFNTSNLLIEDVLLSVISFIKDITNSIPIDNKTVIKEIQSSLTTIVDNNSTSIINKITSSVSSTENKLTSNLLNLLAECNKQNVSLQNINTDLNKYINKFSNSTSKGIMSENFLLKLIMDEYTTAEIKDNRKLTGMADFELIRNDTRIFIENKDYSKPITKQEIDKFIRDITSNNSHGIFISQNSGIPYRNNYEVNIYKNKIIVVYIHNMNYDIQKLNIAVNIIDTLNNKLKEISCIDNIIISTEDINNIEQMLNEHDNHLTELINHTKKSFNTYNELFKKLKYDKIRIILDRYIRNIEVIEYKCNYCKLYTSINKKSINIHESKCKKKNSKET